MIQKFLKKNTNVQQNNRSQFPESHNMVSFQGFIYFFYALTNVSFYDLKLFMEWIEKFHNITNKNLHIIPFLLLEFFFQLENIREGGFTYYITFSQESLTFISGIFIRKISLFEENSSKKIFGYYLYFQLMKIIVHTFASTRSLIRILVLLHVTKFKHISCYFLRIQHFLKFCRCYLH